MSASVSLHIHISNLLVLRWLTAGFDRYPLSFYDVLINVK